jgi:hypothetical protein
MATFNYARGAATAQRMLNKFGDTVTLVRMTPGTGPAHKPGPAVPTNYSVKGALLPASAESVSEFDNEFKAGTLTLDRVRLFYLSSIDETTGVALTIEPKAGDLLLVGDERWSMLGSTPLKPSTTSVLHYGAVKRL